MKLNQFKLANMNSVYDRRKFIGEYFFLSSAILSVAALISGCGAKQGSQKEGKNNIVSDPCEDLSSVSENDIDVRTKSGYCIYWAPRT